MAGPHPFAAIAELLEIKTQRATTPMSFIGEIERGLKPTVAAKVARTIAPGNAAFTYAFVAKPTLARRLKARQRLTVDESGRLTRAARIWTHALAVWKAEDTARAFLFKPHPMLENRTPIDVAIATDLGADLVDQLLGRLEYGSAA